MYSHKNRTKTLLAVALVSLMSACGSELCVEENLEKDAQYRFTFVELYNENSTETAWDPAILEKAGDPLPQCDRLIIAPMTGFTATAVEATSKDYPNSCTSWSLEISEFDGARSIMNGSLGRGSDFTSYASIGGVHADIDLAGCNAEWSIWVLAPKDGDPFRAISPSEPPPLIIRRQLEIYENDGCGDTRYFCQEYWAATVERVL